MTTDAVKEVIDAEKKAEAAIEKTGKQFERDFVKEIRKLEQKAAKEKEKIAIEEEEALIALTEKLEKSFSKRRSQVAKTIKGYEQVTDRGIDKVVAKLIPLMRR